MTYAIALADSDAEIAACFPVLRELRPHLRETEFVARVRRQQAAGYRLAALREDGRVLAAAGYRLGENLAWGRFLYVDDLVTHAAARSRGLGRELLAWLRERAAAEGCALFTLDSGVQRKDAHRFYEREGLSVTSMHFAAPVAGRRTAA